MRHEQRPHQHYCHLVSRNRKLWPHTPHWDIIDSKNVEEAWTYFKRTLEDISNKTIPMKRVNKKKSLFMSKEALKMKKQKDKSYKKYRQTRTDADLAKYKRDRNDLRKMTRKLRADFEKKLASGLKSDAKSFWKYCKVRSKSEKNINRLHKSDGSVILEPSEKATALNQYFGSVFMTEDLTLIPAIANSSTKTIEDINITPEIVKAKLLKLGSHKSQGPDGIHPRILKETAEEVCIPLAKIFRKSVDARVLPQDWKTANITPIHKKGSKTSVENYRPVSLTSQVCKTLESIIRDEVVIFYMEHNILSDGSQHGFVPGRSCVSQLLQVLEDWTENLDRGIPIDTFYLYFKKAFDSVAHNRLEIMLESLGIREKLLQWIKGFITGRTQRVVLEGQASEWVPVTSGVPQGSVLGPTLFIAVIHSLPDEIRSTVKVYADDTKVYRPITNPQDAEQLQEDLDRLVSWSNIWQLPFNIEKCKVMHIGNTNPKFEYSMASQKLEVTSQEKDLGVIVDNSLSFHAHTDAVVARAYRTLGIIRRTFIILDETTLPLVYKAMVRPILEYANTVWGPIFIGDQWKIERVQKRATKMVAAIKHLPYEDRLRRLKLPSLRYRRDRGDMLTVYNLLSNKIRIDASAFFALSTGNTETRGHSKKLKKPTANKAHRQRFFSHRVIDLWNSLPATAISSETVNEFKRELDKHWKHRMYS